MTFEDMLQEPGVYADNTLPGGGLGGRGGSFMLSLARLSAARVRVSVQLLALGTILRWRHGTWTAQPCGTTS